MKNWKPSKVTSESLVSLLLLFWGLSTITSTQALSPGQTLIINGGKGSGNLTSETTTSGVIVGAGILNGTTTAKFVEFKESGGGLEGVANATLSYVATVVITTNFGEVRLQDVGIFDTASVPNKKFSSLSQVTGGTDAFKGATGFLFFHGDVFPDGRFADEISGEIKLA